MQVLPWAYLAGGWSLPRSFISPTQKLLFLLYIYIYINTKNLHILNLNVLISIRGPTRGNYLKGYFHKILLREHAPRPP